MCAGLTKRKRLASGLDPRYSITFPLGIHSEMIRKCWGFLDTETPKRGKTFGCDKRFQMRTPRQCRWVDANERCNAPGRLRVQSLTLKILSNSPFVPILRCLMATERPPYSPLLTSATPPRPPNSPTWVSSGLTTYEAGNISRVLQIL